MVMFTSPLLSYQCFLKSGSWNKENKSGLLPRLFFWPGAFYSGRVLMKPTSAALYKIFEISVIILCKAHTSLYWNIGALDFIKKGHPKLFQCVLNVTTEVITILGHSKGLSFFLIFMGFVLLFPILYTRLSLSLTHFYP
jgi:hypothetical protein